MTIIIVMIMSDIFSGSEVCREQKILILSDEIYGRLTFSRKFESMVKVRDFAYNNK